MFAQLPDQLHIAHPQLTFSSPEEALEEQLGKSEFLVGSSVTLADIVLVFWTADHNITKATRRARLD